MKTYTNRIKVIKKSTYYLLIQAAKIKKILAEKAIKLLIAVQTLMKVVVTKI